MWVLEQGIFIEERLPSIFCSPKAVSRGGPNKAVESSLTGVCWLVKQKQKPVASVTADEWTVQKMCPVISKIMHSLCFPMRWLPAGGLQCWSCWCRGHRGYRSDDTPRPGNLLTWNDVQNVYTWKSAVKWVCTYHVHYNSPSVQGKWGETVILTRCVPFQPLQH